MTATPATADPRPLRLLRRALDRVERVLRPDADHDDLPSPAREPAEDLTGDPEVDSTTTRELLVPKPTGEPAAARASRQAQDYLERRRRKLNHALDVGR